MKISESQQFEYDCQDVQELLILLLVCPEELTIDERWEVTSHLNKCSVCREDYESMIQTSEVLIANRDYLRKSGVFGNTQIDRNSIQMSHEETMEQRFQERLNRAGNRSKRREHKERIAKIKRLVKPVSAVAACLVVCLGLFWAVSQYRTGDISPTIASNESLSSVKIELISGNSTEIIPSGETVVAGDALKTLRINGNRQIALNAGAKLSIEPYNLGCLVKLDRGEIYTEVEHDGKPFMVETSHGRAVITGTTFNIKTDHDKMDLAVVEGSVCFESEKGTVTVQGGYQSSIAGNKKPSSPVVCDAIQIIQWAKGLEANEIIPVNQPDVYFSEMLDLPVTFIPYCDLEDINFDRWIDQRREWFEREFWWTKRLKNLLAQDGVEVDTIDLLIESGDLWRFAWPEYSQQRFLAEDRQVIQGMANLYGIEASNLLFAESFSNCEANSNIEAFERWLDAFEKGNNKLIDSIHAATFLINTRFLAWHAVNGGHIQVEGTQQVLELLKEQANIASDMLEVLNKMLLADSKGSVCSEAQYEEWVKKIKSDICIMIGYEHHIRDLDMLDNRLKQ